MSWSDQFYAALMSSGEFASLISSLSFEYKADAKAPYATYQLITQEGTEDLDGSGVEGYYLIQLNIWASSPTKTHDLAALAVESAKQNLVVTDVFQRSLSRSADDELFGYAVDFTVWFDNP